MVGRYQNATLCHCNKNNDVNRALICQNGCYVIHRHNRVPDLEAEIMREVCVDVKFEPELLSLHNMEFNESNAEKARLNLALVSGLLNG